jgi:hypothetical protein
MRPWVRRAASIAAAAVIAAVAAWLLLGRVSTASASFAEMVRRVCQAKTVSYDSTLRIPGHQDVRYNVSLSQTGQRRIVWPDRVQVLDPIQQEGLVLYPATQKARLFEVSPQAADPVENLREAGDSASQFIGKEFLGGREAMVYQVASKQQIMRVWVDPKEELPVRMEIRAPAKDGPETVTIFDNFCWNCPIPESSFSLNLPPGYSFDQSRDYKIEESLAHLLKTCADISGGVFPAQMEPVPVQILLSQERKDGGIALNGELTRTTDLGEQGKESLRVCLGGLAFMEQVKAGGTWRYCGQGTRLGDAKAAICWWQPPGAQNYRVMYGDLQLKDVTKKNLPTTVAPSAASESAEQILEKTQAPGLRN